MTTEAQKRAIEKYNQKFFMLRFRVPLEKYERVKDLAYRNGESIAAMFNRLIDQELDRN